MDCLVRLFYEGNVTKQDGLFEDIEEELEMFDDPPSFSDLVLRVKEKFEGDFTLMGRFDSGKKGTLCHNALARPGSLVPLHKGNPRFKCDHG